MTITIVTDSTCDLEPELCASYGIKVVPLFVLFDGKMHKDRVEISANDLLNGIKAGKKIPSTSQPSPSEFSDVYREALLQSEHVISIHISSFLSGTVGSARLAAMDFPQKVTIVDSKTVTLGLGLRVIRAAEMARQGKSVAEIIAVLESLSQQAELSFIVDTLDFLKLSGRITGAAALLGGLLNIKPTLVVKDGRVESGTRARGRQKAMADLIDFARRFSENQGGSRISFMYTLGGESGIADLRKGLSGVDYEDMGEHGIGAVVATHAGPGAVGMAMEPKRPRL